MNSQQFNLALLEVFAAGWKGICDGEMTDVEMLGTVDLHKSILMANVHRARSRAVADGPKLFIPRHGPNGDTPA